MGILLGVIPAHAQTTPTAEEYLSSGDDALKAGRVDRAIVLFSKALELNPNLSKAYDNRGVAYAHEGSLARAIADFTMAIANNPRDAQAYNNRGHAYADQDNFDQAVFDYSRAIEIDPFYVKAYNNRGVAYYMLREYDKALNDAHTVRAIGGTVDPYFEQTLKQIAAQN